VLGSLSDLRLNSDSVVDGRSDALLAPEVSLGGLDRDVTEKELDLFQFAAGSVPKTRVVSTQIKQRQFLDPGSRCELRADMPDNLSVMPSPQTLPALFTRRKTLSKVSPTCVEPVVENLLDQSGIGAVRV
jgi:hypothetical protein